MLSISEFSEMCHLPAQTLRYYHREELLVPAEVDDRTGHRSYRFEQVERAMLITVLRGTGMSVSSVKQALREPEGARESLRQHIAAVRQQRQEQDAAISDAQEFLRGAWPQVHQRHTPAVTVVSRLVPRRPTGTGREAWVEDDLAVMETVRNLVAVAESCGARVSGTAWRALADETPEQKKALLSGEGPWWVVKVPVTADRRALATLAEKAEVGLFPACDELSILIPGRPSMAKYGTALSRLLRQPLHGSYLDVGRMRHLLHDDGVETAAAIRSAARDEAAKIAQTL
ncbi:MerR family transcriptional regulator [Streptomyces cinnabarinus]|uniref:MerR family transcriptional regulator n=1 Tax=Streptomyces cinnabarinus TaxID=67287 RepID=A0ABY7K3H5_9ACTN|nr:MerR family transcriptional regulator [Streptomyces cinnabarinus]WAZ19034.1 MerR family transcriptional regulator [Streptomyces cinnabarinus]